MHAEFIYHDIKPNFDCGAETYEKVAWVQKQSAQLLVKLLLEHCLEMKPRTILDVGSGTGYIVEELLPHFPGSIYTLNDISPHMLGKAREKLANLINANFCLQDAEQYLFPYHDLIISNFAFQWFADIAQTLPKLWEQTGILAFSTLLEGTFAEWWELCIDNKVDVPRSKYPTYYELQHNCMALNPSYSYFIQVEMPLCMESPVEFLRYIKQLGAGFGSLCRYSTLMPIVKQHHQALNTSYKVFFAILRK